MGPKLVETEKDDDVLEQLRGLAGDARDSYEAFKKKLTSGLLADPTVLVTEVGEMFSILADVAQYAFQAHSDHFEWSGEVDSDLEEIKETLGETESILLAEDALRLRETISALVQNLREPTGSDDDIPAILKKRAEDALAFIEEVTAEDPEDPEETET